MNRQEAAKLLAVLSSAYPLQAAKIPAETIKLMPEVWADLLGDLSYVQCNAAIRSLLQTSTYWPSIAEVRRTVVELEMGPVRGGGDAWGDVLAAVSRVGAYRSPTFADPVVSRCVSSLGWRQLCLSENQVADRARFVDLYDRLACDMRHEQQSPVLAEANRHRALLGAQRLISDVARVLSGGRTDEPDGDAE